MYIVIDKEGKPISEIVSFGTAMDICYKNEGSKIYELIYHINHNDILKAVKDLAKDDEKRKKNGIVQKVPIKKKSTVKPYKPPKLEDVVITSHKVYLEKELERKETNDER